MFSPVTPPNPPLPTPSVEGGGGFGGLKSKEQEGKEFLKELIKRDDEDIIIILSSWMASKNKN